LQVKYTAALTLLSQCLKLFYKRFSLSFLRASSALIGHTAQSVVIGRPLTARVQKWNIWLSALPQHFIQSDTKLFQSQLKL